MDLFTLLFWLLFLLSNGVDAIFGRIRWPFFPQCCVYKAGHCLTIDFNMNYLGICSCSTHRISNSFDIVLTQFYAFYGILEKEYQMQTTIVPEEVNMDMEWENVLE